MLPSQNGWALALAAAAALNFSSFTSAQTPPQTNQTTNPPRKQSVFVSPNDELAFGITIPDDPSSQDIYFSLAAQPAMGWAAVGLGSDSMSNALILMIYVSGSGSNVTFSPRLSSPRAEPTLYPDLKVETLPGTGFTNNSLLMFRGRCSNCRKWGSSGGSIDVNSAEQRCIYASGPGKAVNSDDRNAPLAFHSSYGAFTINLRDAKTSSPEAPLLNLQTARDSVGAKLIDGSNQTGKRDWAALLHAIVMIFCFVGLLPFGVVILRVCEWVRWHAVNQAIALCGIITGFGLGIHISFKYNRSKSFNNPHQVIGLIIFIFIFAQFILGILHHRIHGKKKAAGGGDQGSKLAPFHVWLGRTVIVMGVINGFLGFPFALSPGYNYILAGLVLAITPVIAFLLFFKAFFRKKLWGKRSAPPQSAPYDGGGGSAERPPAYEQEPWRVAYNNSQPGPASEQRGPSIGLSNLASSLSSSRNKERGATLGTQQTPREYV